MWPGLWGRTAYHGHEPAPVLELVVPTWPSTVMRIATELPHQSGPLPSLGQYE